MKQGVIDTACGVAMRCRSLKRDGLVSDIGGNVSFRIDVGMAISATGTDMTSLAGVDFIPVTINNAVLGEYQQPSREYKFHTGIYRNQPEVDYVLHSHPVYAVALDEVPDPALITAQGLGEIAVVQALPAGSMDLAMAVTDAYRSSRVKVALLRNHGLVTIGKTLDEAIHLAECYEYCAKVTLLRGAYNEEA